MEIHLPNDVLIVPSFRFSANKENWNNELERWLSDLLRSIENYFKNAYYDVSMGRSKFSVYTSEPTISDLDDGQIALYNANIYTKANNTLYKIVLSEVRNRNLNCKLTVVH